MNERVFAPRLNVFGLILARGAERGEIPPGAVSPLVADLGPAMLVRRFPGDSAPIPDEFLLAIVDDLAPARSGITCWRDGGYRRSMRHSSIKPVLHFRGPF